MSADASLPKPPRPLTRKQQAFIKHLVDNPKSSATEAAAQSYEIVNRNTAKSIATENLTKPAIRSELAKYNGMLESALIKTVDDWKDHEKPRQREIAMDVAKYVHDKVHGKATQRVEQHTETVSISINLNKKNSPDDNR